MRSHVSGTECAGFSNQDTRGNLVVALLPVNFPFSAFCRRFPLQTSGQNCIFLVLVNIHQFVHCVGSRFLRAKFLLDRSGLPDTTVDYKKALEARKLLSASGSHV